MSETEARPEAPQPRPETTTPAGGEPAPSGEGDSGDVSPAGNAGADASAGDAPRKRRRRGSRGGRKRAKAGESGESGDATDGDPGTTGGAGENGQPAEAGEGAGTRAGGNRRGAAAGGNSNRGGRAGKGNGGSGGPTGVTTAAAGPGDPGDAGAGATAAAGGATGEASGADRTPELPDPPGEGQPSPEAGERALVRRTPTGAPTKPKIGDTMPAPPPAEDEKPARSGRRRRGGAKGGRGTGDAGQGGNGGPAGSGGSSRASEEAGNGGRRSRSGGGQRQAAEAEQAGEEGDEAGGRRRRRRRGGRGRGGGAGAPGEGQPVQAMLPTGPVELDDEALERRRGRERKGRPVGRYMMCVQVAEKATQIAVLEGRALIEHYVSHPSDDISQIHGNVYLGRVQNVLPGMEAAFVDIGTPKNAVLYRGDIHYDQEDVDRVGGNDRNRQPPRIEQMLRAGQTILCQVTKNPIGAKGARLTQEVSLPGRFVVLIPNSSTYGISKRLSDDERKRLRQVLDRVKPAQHGIIVRTAAEGVTSEEIENDVRRLLAQWQQIDSLAKRSKAPKMLYREPDMAVRVIREEFNKDYRGVVIDDEALYEQVRDYVGSISPALADRVEYYDPSVEKLPLFERHHVHEQLHRALDRKVWLPSGGSLIIEHTEALTVIDVNTGKNVGKSSLEETVFKNNLEAAVEIARQLRLRDIGGIIVVDFIDMERRDNRDEVVKVFRDALSRDKTRTQVFDISELGLCEMTRKRIGEGLLESFSGPCPVCEGRGVVVDKELLPD